MKPVLLSALIVCTFTTSSLAYADSGAAELKGTSEAFASIEGRVELKEEAEGLRVSAEVKNVPPGQHGFHIHEFGLCDDAGKAAGDHYNPDHVLHGYLPKDGFLQAHAGDLGNIDIAPDGTGKIDVVVPNLTLSGGKYSVGGRSVVLHAKPDDFGQPAGNAGDRIACGEIRILSK